MFHIVTQDAKLERSLQADAIESDDEEEDDE